MMELDLTVGSNSLASHSKSWGKSSLSKLTSSIGGGGGTNTAAAVMAASLIGSNDKPAGSNQNMLNKRRIGPSSSQLYLVRTMLELMIDQSSSGKHSMRKELDSSTLVAIESFIKHSFYWPYLLSFSGKLFY